MPSGNLDEPVTTSSPHAEPPRAFRLPADYYGTPPSDVRALFPKWVPLGCGTASAVLLVLLFVAGAIVTGPRLAQFMDFVVGSSLGDLKGMYAKDVNAGDKARFDAEVKQLRANLRSGKVSMQNFQPFLKLMQSVMIDKKVTHDEVDHLTKAAHESTLKGTKKTPPVEEPAARDHQPLAH